MKAVVTNLNKSHGKAKLTFAELDHHNALKFFSQSYSVEGGGAFVWHVKSSIKEDYRHFCVMCAALLRRVVLERVSEATTKFSKSALSKIMFKQARARAIYQAACAHVSARRLETSHTATLKQLSQTSEKIFLGPSEARLAGLRSVKQEFTHLIKAASLCWKDEHWEEIQQVQQRFTHAIDEVEAVGVAATLAGYDEFCTKHAGCREHCRDN